MDKKRLLQINRFLGKVFLRKRILFDKISGKCLSPSFGHFYLD